MSKSVPCDVCFGTGGCPPSIVCSRCNGAGILNERTERARSDCDKPPSDPLAVQHGGQHYKSLAIQPVEFCQRNGIKFAESSAIKYLTRHKDKGGAEDLKKALHFCQLALQLEYGIGSEVTYKE